MLRRAREHPRQALRLHREVAALQAERAALLQWLLRQPGVLQVRPQ